MEIELRYADSPKGTQLLDGNKAEIDAVKLITSNYDLSGYKVQLHLIEPEKHTPRTEASYVSLRKKARTLGSVGILPQVYIHPFWAGIESLRGPIDQGNQDPDTIGIVVQMPIPTSLHTACSSIDFIKDLDSLNPHNDYWVRCATADVSLRILQTYGQSNKIGLVGSNGFIGRDIMEGIQSDGLGELVCIEFGDSLGLLKYCDTIISAVGQPSLVKARHLKENAFLGIDIGYTKSNNIFLGDFDVESIDGKLNYLTPVPGGMGPLEMVAILERVVRNALGVGLNFKFLTK